ncbi:hypothetical protein HMPREF0424_0361 [Gardnerella vaginalis 409-05]|nr:hypothetical protein HMPREF0424_0361 [Gardnerella vaginalis 409-05]
MPTVRGVVAEVVVVLAAAVADILIFCVLICPKPLNFLNFYLILVTFEVIA